MVINTIIRNGGVLRRLPSALPRAMVNGRRGNRQTLRNRLNPGNVQVLYELENRPAMGLKLA